MNLRRLTLVAVKLVVIGNDRDIDGVDNAAGIVGHLGHRDEPAVRITRRRRSNPPRSPQVDDRISLQADNDP
jgi:hypothetical protein